MVDVGYEVGNKNKDRVMDKRIWCEKYELKRER